jgi:hypothetical protein
MDGYFLPITSMQENFNDTLEILVASVVTLPGLQHLLVDVDQQAVPEDLATPIVIVLPLLLEPPVHQVLESTRNGILLLQLPINLHGRILPPTILNWCLHFI